MDHKCPHKESGLSFEETTPKKNLNPQTHMNSSETRKSPLDESVCCMGVGALRHKMMWGAEREA